MIKYISLNPKHPAFNETGGPEPEIQAYRALTTWLVAALIQEGHLHITQASLNAAIAYLEASAERPTFSFEQFSDGCKGIWLAGYSSHPSSPLNN